MVWRNFQNYKQKISAIFFAKIWRFLEQFRGIWTPCQLFTSRPSPLSSLESHPLKVWNPMRPVPKPLKTWRSRMLVQAFSVSSQFKASVKGSSQELFFHMWPFNLFHFIRHDIFSYLNDRKSREKNRLWNLLEPQLLLFDPQIFFSWFFLSNTRISWDLKKFDASLFFINHVFIKCQYFGVEKMADRVNKTIQKHMLKFDIYSFKKGPTTRYLHSNFKTL